MQRSLECLVEEIVVPDVHNNWDIYRRLELIVGPATTRVFIIGDLRNEINPKRLGEFVPTSYKNTIEAFKRLEEKLHKVIVKYGSETAFNEALRSGKLAQEEQELFRQYVTVANELEEVADECYAKESAVDYDRHEAEIAKVRKKVPTVLFHGVPGNHDTRFIEKQVNSVQWLVYDQQLQNKGIIGAFVCRENVGETNPRFNGPNLKYVPFKDDDYDDLANSELYGDWKDTRIDLMVAHCGGNWGESRKHKGGLGITQLGKEQGFVCYSGHDHDGIVYRDPESKVLVIRPGVNHIAKVFRNGKDVERILMYRVPGPARRRHAD